MVETLKEILEEKKEALECVRSMARSSPVVAMEAATVLDKLNRQIADLERIITALDFPRPFSVTP